MLHFSSFGLLLLAPPLAKQSLHEGKFCLIATKSSKKCCKTHDQKQKEETTSKTNVVKNTPALGEAAPPLIERDAEKEDSRTLSKSLGPNKSSSAIWVSKNTEKKKVQNSLSLSLSLSLLFSFLPSFLLFFSVSLSLSLSLSLSSSSSSLFSSSFPSLLSVPICAPWRH